MLAIIFISAIIALFLSLKIRLELFRNSLKVGDKVIVHFSKTEVAERKVLGVTTTFYTNFRNKKKFKVKVVDAVIVKSFNDLKEQLVTLDKIYQTSYIDSVFYKKGND